MLTARHRHIDIHSNGRQLRDAIQVLEDTVVLATVATDEDDDEAPDNTRNQ
jgi:hypothetical protein